MQRIVLGSRRRKEVLVLEIAIEIGRDLDMARCMTH
jgi:hypothetical protein